MWLTCIWRIINNITGEEVEGEEAVDVLRDLSELAKEVQAEIDRVRRDGPESTLHAAG